ncbi:ArnT family glycosyltransferase [Paracoccus sp. NGMCC 1.201697]|uniref:ArnT family glycosyltransferase n=1 Tax=Paracoccus broussonetiae subsp. drimophilus TaxID=3373869 RepID=A0ABW7LKY8_9RHOB
MRRLDHESGSVAVAGSRPTLRGLGRFLATDRDWTGMALAGIALITFWRIVALYFNRTELWVDEAQYWLWGQSFSFGAYSKPPLIGWLIGAMTGLLGNSTFAVRLAAPLIHGLAACTVLALTARVASPRAAALAGLGYATMPAVTLGSMLISTDTPQMLALALALLVQHRLARAPGVSGAILLGLAVGLGLLAKQAMAFAVLGMGLAGWISADWRIARRDLILATAVTLAVVAPNLWWIASHGFVTFHHLAESGSSQGFGLHISGTLRFWAEQFAVMGPVAFAALLLSLRNPPQAMHGPLAVAVVILGIVTLQALGSHALANWAVSFTVAGNIVAAVWLAERPRLAAISIGFGLVVALLLPLLAIFGTGWRGPGGSLLLSRYMGHAEISARAIDYAHQHDTAVITAHDRGLLADLSWQARGTRLRIEAAPHTGGPRHHWDLAFPFNPKEPGLVAVLLVGEPPACATTSESWTAGPGFAEGRKFTLAMASAACLMDASHE